MSTVSSVNLVSNGVLMSIDRVSKIKTGIAVSDNKLINACYRMSAIQKRVFNMAIAASHSRKLNSGEVVFDVQDYAELAQTSLKEAIRVCRKEAKKMSQLQVVNIEYKEKRCLSPRKMLEADRREESSDREVARVSYKNFFQEVEFIDNSDAGDSERCYMYFKFSEWLLPYIELIRKRFSKIPLMEVSTLSSFYALRIFDLGMGVKVLNGIRRREFDYPDFREKLGFVDDKVSMYSAWTDFRKRCLVDPLKELNEKSSFEWSYSLIGRGETRKIVITSVENEQLDLPIN